MPTIPIIRKIEQHLAEMRKAEPPEKGYADYKSFRRDMQIIPANPFREKFLLQQIDLAHHCHTSGVHYNFLKLYRHYRRCSPKKIIILPEDAVNKLFGIFENEILVKSRTRGLLNSILKGQRLNDSHLKFLVKNAFESEFVLNRVLQYPFASDIILNWVKQHAEDARLSTRRIEVTSLLLDERLYAHPPISLLYCDMKIRFESLKEMELYLCIAKMRERKGWVELAAEHNYEIKLFISRMNTWPEKYSIDCWADKPEEIETLRGLVFNAAKHTGLYFTEFGDVIPIDLHQSRVTVWAIAYSRLDISIKINMLKHEFREELKNSYLYIARRLKSVELLEWLLKVCKNGNKEGKVI